MEGTGREEKIAGRHRAAVESERAAWGALASRRDGRKDEQRAADLERWLEANRDLRETQALLTAIAVQTATDSMRECATILASEPRAAKDAYVAAAAGTRRVTPPAPVQGMRYRGRGGTSWLVLAVTHDALEAGYYLAQLECHRAGRRADEVFDVYSEDWKLFCLVYGLEADRQQRAPDREDA